MKRIDYANSEKIFLSREVRLRSIVETSHLIQTEPSVARGTRYASLAYSYRSIGLGRYALGEPLNDISEELRNAVSAYIEVIKVRGTEGPIPQWRASLDECQKPLQPLLRVDSPTQVDFSLGNSAATFDFCAIAYLVHDFASVALMVENMIDPEGMRFRTVSPNQQMIAYAFRELFKGDFDAAIKCTLRVDATITEYERCEVDCVVALVSGNHSEIRGSLHRLLEVHANVARGRENCCDPSFFVSLPAINFAALALRVGVLLDDIHQSSFFPLKMIEATH